MILKSLVDYYDNNDLPKFGFENKDIYYIIVIDENGKFINLQSTIEDKKPKNFIVPKGIKRSGKKASSIAYFLWDHYGYVLGYFNEKHLKKKQVLEQQLEKTKIQFESFVNKISELPEDIKNKKEINAVINFYENKEYEKVIEDEVFLNECIKKSGTNISFRMIGDDKLICQKPYIIDYISNNLENDNLKDVCCVTGKTLPIERLHSPVNVRCTSPNAAYISFQTNSGFDHMWFNQGYNASVSSEISFKYTTALNNLIKNNSISINDSVIIFWVDKKNEDSLDFSLFFNDTSDSEKGIQQIKSLYKSVYSGVLNIENDYNYNVLCLAPNLGRITTRYYKKGNLLELGKNIIKHFEDSKIVGQNEYISIRKLLTCTTLKYKDSNVKPNEVNKLIFSVFDNLKYSSVLYNNCLKRIKAEKSINQTRASLLKCYLNRNYNKGIKMSLDKENNNIGYLLGRYFATVEKIQKDASPGLNKTIKDRLIDTFSTKPNAVFQKIEKTKRVNLKKIKSEGKRIYYDKMINEIFEKINSVPCKLSLDDKGMYMVGYYHQNNDFYKKCEPTV